MSPIIDLRAADLAPGARTRASEALALLRRGFSLVPMLPRSKEPHHAILSATFGVATWAPLKARAASPAEVVSWFEHDPEASIAAILGDDMAAVDIDHPELWEGLPLPPTLAHVSSWSECGKPRTHLLYRVDRPLATTRHAFGDVLGAGHLVIVPPSVHPSGDPYQWLDGLAPGDVELATAPAWVYGAESEGFMQGRAAGAAALKALDSRAGTPPFGVSNTVSYPEQGSSKDGRPDFPFRALAEREDVALAIMQAAGVEAKGLGKSFHCPLPGHDDKKASVALWHEDGRPIALHDFHGRDGDEWWPLPDVFAALKTRTTRRLGRAERETWWLRALFEAGQIQRPHRRAPRLEGAPPPAARRLYDGFRLLLDLRSHHDASQTTAPYAWDFAGAWCGIPSKSEVQRGMQWLLARRYLVVVQRASGRHASLLALGRLESAV